MIKNFNDIINMAQSRGPVRVVVAQAADTEVLKAVALARQKGLVEGILTGVRETIIKLLKEINEEPNNYTIIQAADYVDCAIKAVANVKSKQADILMKGLLPTDAFLRPVLSKEHGILMGKLISQVSVFQWTDEDRLLFITDCAINIAPNLEQKKQILLNGIELMRSINLQKPRVAILAPNENINSNMQETIDAAALSKMAERGEFLDAIVDGPLAFDAAISEEAIQTKGILSPVGGKSDMLLVPCLNTGNAIHKTLVNIAKLPAAGVVMGAQSPIVSTSRSDSAETKLYSIALASCLVK